MKIKLGREREREKQLLALFVFSLIGAIVGIAHGIIFDMKIEEIYRLSVLGVILTTLVVYPAILFLEWVFDWNNKIWEKKLEKREKGIERKEYMLEEEVKIIKRKIKNRKV